MIGRVDLGVGAEAHAVVTRPIGKGDKMRREVEGIAVVCILDNHVDGRFDIFRVKVLRSSEHIVGREIEIHRCDLYASNEPAEMAEFNEFVEFAWGAKGRAR